jgi:hypothetical protein
MGGGGRRIPASGTDLKSPKGLYSNRGFPWVGRTMERERWRWVNEVTEEELLVECGVVAPRIS